MPDTDNVIDLDKIRAERQQAEGQEAHDRGEAFKLITFVFADEKSDLPSVNLVDDEQTPVAILIGSSLLGLQMSKEDAVQLATALLSVTDYLSCAK